MSKYTQDHEYVADDSRIFPPHFSPLPSTLGSNMSVAGRSNHNGSAKPALSGPYAPNFHEKLQSKERKVKEREALGLSNETSVTS